jgi:hypothetical protein
MTKPLPWGGRVPLLLLLPIGLLPLFATVQRTIPQGPSSRFQDWTTRHVLYPQFGTSRTLDTARNDPRALFRWREVEQRQQAPRFIPPNQMRDYLFFRFRGRHTIPFPTRGAADIHADWNISLGGGSTGEAQFPAKFSFNTTAPTDCTNDFVVFPVNVAGSGTQPNIVAFNNLYSGNAGAVGICDGRGTPTGHSDTKTSATVLWSYNVHAVTAGAPVPGSPVLSLDGKKVAFVESGGGAGHFHVLAWKSGDGQATNLQTVTSPLPITAFTNPTAPVAGSGTASELVFGSLTDTLSSPYVDYSNDIAYVGNDAGVLFRIKNVFCTLASCANAAPSIDTTWGSSGSVTVCAGKLTSPVQDFLTGNVFVGCSNGNVYGFNSAGAALSTPFFAVGNGTAKGGVVDPPIVDGTNGFVYAVSGSGAPPNNASGVLVQAKTNMSSVRISVVGDGGFQDLHAPAFNDAYFTNATSTTWLIYTGGFDATDANLVLYGTGFDGSRNMNTGNAGNSFSIGTRPGEWAPLTEFKNGANDYLFIGILLAPPNFARSTINAFPAVAPTQPGTGLPGTSTGTSGMIVDNSSASAQASSLYFASSGSNTAVKYTQVGLQ